MLLVVPTEVRNHEARVAATPETVKKFMQQGFEVRVQQGAGAGAFFADTDYEEVGADTVADAARLYERADAVLKVWAP